MRLVRIILHRLRSLLFQSRVEDGLDREIGLHLDALTADLMAEGMSEAEARREARKQFGSPELAKDQCRDTRRVNLVEDFVKDTIYAWRSLRRSPGFATTAIISLALGIGANTVVFSVLSSMLLRPLPAPEPDRIRSVNDRGRPSISFPAYRDIRDRNTVFESLVASRVVQVALGDQPGGARRIWGYLATGNYFQALGVQPAVGRFFTPAEDRAVNASPYVVLSYDCWQSRFAGDPAIAGKPIRMNGRPYQVLGVAPRGFRGTELFFWPELWLPASMQPQVEGWSSLECRGCGNFWVAGRLKDGVSAEQAEAGLGPVGAQLAREHRAHQGMKLTLSPPGLIGSTGREPIRAFIGGVMLLAGVVLLAACSNLAVLQTARAVDRERDLAIRLSIGASRGRIVRQVVTESMVLSLLGGLAGLGLAAFLLQLLSQWRAPLEFPIQFDVAADWRVLAFACVAAAATGALLSIGLARRAWRSGPALTIKASGHDAPGRRWSSHDVLLPVQIALCCALVTASVVAARGLISSLKGPLGFRPDGVAVASYDVSFVGANETRGRALQQAIGEELARLPGVESTAYASSVPLNLDQSTGAAYPEATTEFIPKNAIGAAYYRVSPGYFQTTGTALLAGREFTSHDHAKAPVVAIVNQFFVKRVLRPGDPVGQRFRHNRNDLVEVVGVVEDGKYETLTEPPRAAVFYSILQSYSPTVVLLARSARHSGEVANEMRQVVLAQDPNLAVYALGDLRQMLGLVYLPMRAAAIALGAFGILAVMLAVTGIYGLSSYAVARRSKEIGIRMAIGAGPAQVVRLVFGRLGRLVALGAVLGLAVASLSSNLLSAVVYTATPRDPAVIALAAICMAAVSLAAALGPARRSIRIDPLRSLRQD